MAGLAGVDECWRSFLEQDAPATSDAGPAALMVDGAWRSFLEQDAPATSDAVPAALMVDGAWRRR